MRTLRLSLVGTVILALLGGLGGAVLAKKEASPPAMAPAVFTGKDTGASWKMSDPRVKGSRDMTWEDEASVDPDGDGFDAGYVEWGTLTLEGPDGDWTGPFVQMSGDDLPTFSRRIVTLEGTEAYEGWAVVAWITTPDGWQYPDWQEVEGVIYEGSAPRLEWPEPPAE